MSFLVKFHFKCVGPFTSFTYKYSPLIFPCKDKSRKKRFGCVWFIYIMLFSFSPFFTFMTLVNSKNYSKPVRKVRIENVVFIWIIVFILVSFVFCIYIFQEKNKNVDFKLLLIFTLFGKHETYIMFITFFLQH